MQILEKQIFKISSKASPSANISETIKKELQNIKFEYKKQLESFKNEIRHLK